jgi:hypothetical protein
MTIPLQTLEYVRSIFRSCNLIISNKLTKQPGTWEESLDQSFIDHLSNYSAPLLTEKNWVVRVDTHFLGGMRHWGRWEIADIGILIIFRRNGKTVKRKVSLLQSKRLYANELNQENEDEKRNYIIGFGRLDEDDQTFRKIISARTLHFNASSEYKALKVNSEQWKAIQDFEKKSKLPVYYLFYNPCKIPFAIEMPLIADINFSSYSVGTRVVPAAHLTESIGNKIANYSPTYDELTNNLKKPFDEMANSGGWRLEDFMCDQLIPCHEGYLVEKNNDIDLYNLFYRRSGPISSAFSITFDFTE